MLLRKRPWKSPDFQTYLSAREEGGERRLEVLRPLCREWCTLGWLAIGVLAGLESAEPECERHSVRDQSFEAVEGTWGDAGEHRRREDKGHDPEHGQPADV